MVLLLISWMMVYEFLFFYIGMDLFGLFYVKYGWGMVKWWCCFFICLNICSVYLELVNFMDIDDFIMCFWRFINCCGDVLEFWCDRGLNFVGVEWELRRSIEEWNG